MIIAEQKNFEEIKKLIAPYNKILLVGCGTCVTVCSAGGTKEVDELSEKILEEKKAAGSELVLEKGMMPRQCSIKFIDRIKRKIEDTEAVLSMACGVGVQTLAKQFPYKIILPALNTNFIGMRESQGVWAEACLACGDCVLGKTAGICPVTRCAKGLLNGPCGGASGGICEVSKDQPCVWQEIYHALKRLNMLHYLKQKPQVKDWPVHPSRVVREDLREVEAA